MDTGIWTVVHKVEMVGGCGDRKVQERILSHARERTSGKGVVDHQDSPSGIPIAQIDFRMERQKDSSSFLVRHDAALEKVDDDDDPVLLLADTPY